MSNQEYIIGDYAVKFIDDYIYKNRPSQILIIRGKNSYFKCGAAIIIKDIISKYNCNTSEFYDFEENPQFEDYVRGVTIAHKINPDLILSIGGGSVIDMAKLIRFKLNITSDIFSKEIKFNSHRVPLFAIPTTSGTGAEATHFAVIYKNKIKYSIAHETIRPDAALLYPLFTNSNNPYLTACCGFDALAQAIEAFWNKNATDESDLYAKSAMSTLWNNLPLAVSSPNYKIRENMALGSYMAGKAIDITKTTAPHAFSYPFTSHYGYPHGHAVSICFPSIAQLNIMGINPKKQAYLMELFGIKDIKSTKKCLSDYIRDLGLKTKSDINYNPQIILSGINMARLANNPIEIDNQTGKSIICESLGISMS